MPSLSNEGFARLSAALMAALVAAAVWLSHDAAASPVEDPSQLAGGGAPPSLIDETAELPPLFPLRGRDYVGYGLAILGLVVAAGGGIGGGGA